MDAASRRRGEAADRARRSVQVTGGGVRQEAGGAEAGWCVAGGRACKCWVACGGRQGVQEDRQLAARRVEARLQGVQKGSGVRQGLQGWSVYGGRQGVLRHGRGGVQLAGGGRWLRSSCGRRRAGRRAAGWS